MRCLAFTFFAKIKIWADNTFIANSYNVMGVAFITSDSGVYNFRGDFLLDKRFILNNFLRFSIFLNFFRFSDPALSNNFFFYFRNNIRHYFGEFLIDRLINAFN